MLRYPEFIRPGTACACLEDCPNSPECLPGSIARGFRFRAQSTTRRQWLKTSATGAAGLALGTIGSASANAKGPSSRSDKNPIKVVVWDEHQPAQKEAYENFLGNQIAAHLKTQEGLAVQSVKLEDPEQGLSPTVLNDCRVLIWWGHVRNSEVSAETAKRIVERIKSGDLALIALHSAHWSAPFVEAMNERARLDLGEQFAIAEGERTEVPEIPPPQRFSVPKKDERPTPFAIARKYPRARSQKAVGPGTSGSRKRPDFPGNLIVLRRTPDVDLTNRT